MRLSIIAARRATLAAREDAISKKISQYQRRGLFAPETKRPAKSPSDYDDRRIVYRNIRNRITKLCLSLSLSL